VQAAELALVAAAVVGIHGALGTVAIHDLPGALGGLVTLIPHAEVTLLAFYAVVRDPRAVRPRGGSARSVATRADQPREPAWSSSNAAPKIKSATDGTSPGAVQLRTLPAPDAAGGAA
jgi:hypothetical protein